MNSNVFIETQNVINFQKGIEKLLKRDRLQPGLLVVEGKSGRGKSMAADNYYSVNDGVFFRVWEDMSQHAFLQELAFETFGTRPRGSHVCKRMIIESLLGGSKVIIVDEADRLALGRLEDLRDINEASGAAIVLIGEEGLLGKLNSKERIYSRVASVVKFEAVKKDEVITYVRRAADLKISQEAASILAKKSNGSFRMIHNYALVIAEFAQVNNLVSIEASHLENMDLRGVK